MLKWDRQKRVRLHQNAGSAPRDRVRNFSAQSSCNKWPDDEKRNSIESDISISLLLAGISSDFKIAWRSKRKTGMDFERFAQHSKKKVRPKTWSGEIELWRHDGRLQHRIADAIISPRPPHKIADEHHRHHKKNLLEWLWFLLNKSFVRSSRRAARAARLISLFVATHR